MKKILFYSDTPQIGGAELQILLLAKFLDKNKYEPILAVSNYKKLDTWCEDFEKEGIKIIRLNVKHKHDPKHYFQLKKILKKEEIDILHIHVWNPASCRYAFYAGSHTKTPIITTEHDPFKLNWLKNLFKKNTLKKIHRIVTVSENNKKILQNLYPTHKNRISTIYNGIDTTWWQSQLLRFTEDDLKEIKTKIFHAKEDTLIITTVAELHERKGQKYLIEAIPKVVEKFPNIKLVLIGEGPDHQNLENLVKKLKLEKHVTILGRRKNIPYLLKSSNIFVLPSRREAFGLVNLEAMLTPLPIIATKVGGIPEIVQHEKTGIIVPPENTSELISALIDLIKNPEKRENYAKEGKKRAFTHFDAKNMAEKYENLYDTTN